MFKLHPTKPTTTIPRSFLERKKAAGAPKTSPNLPQTTKTIIDRTATEDRKGTFSKFNFVSQENLRFNFRSPEKEIPLPIEETVEFNPNDVVLDFCKFEFFSSIFRSIQFVDYLDTSDLNLTINTDCLSATTKSNDALCFLWAGARTTYGFKQGKICYEIRVKSILFRIFELIFGLDR